MQFDLGAFVSGLGGVVSGAVAAAFYLRQMQAELAKLRQDVEQLRETRVSALERRMDRQEENCVGKQQTEELRNLTGWMKKMDGKLDVIGERTAAMAADLQAKGVWIANLNQSHQTHVQDRSIHEVHHG